MRRRILAYVLENTVARLLRARIHRAGARARGMQWLQDTANAHSLCGSATVLRVDIQYRREDVRTKEICLLYVRRQSQGVNMLQNPLNDSYV